VKAVSPNPARSVPFFDGGGRWSALVEEREAVLHLRLGDGLSRLGARKPRLEGRLEEAPLAADLLARSSPFACELAQRLLTHPHEGGRLVQRQDIVFDGICHVAPIFRYLPPAYYTDARPCVKSCRRIRTARLLR